MGTPVTHNLVAKGAVVYGYDLDTERLAASTADGVHPPGAVFLA